MGFAFQKSVWYVRRAQKTEHLVLKDLAYEQEKLHTPQNSFPWMYLTDQSQPSANSGR